VLLHRARGEGAAPEVAVEAAGRQLRLRFPEGWLREKPLTGADLEQEAAWLRPAGVELVVEKS
jgi:exopolyphosphatase/guanosine-5'-triphosphate,3'-diphosphate pyrophosphatase